MQPFSVRKCGVGLFLRVSGMDPINGILLLIFTDTLHYNQNYCIKERNCNLMGLGGGGREILVNTLDRFKSGITPVQSCSLFTSGDTQLTTHSTVWSSASQKVITEDNGATSVCEQNRAPNVHSLIKSLVRNYRVKKEIIKVYLGVF